MGLMDSAMQSDAEFTADTDQFSELCAYTRAAGGAVDVRVVIDRNPPLRDPSFNVNTRAFDIWIPYSSSYGLTSKPAEGDKIDVKDDPADSDTDEKYLRNIVSTDSGGWLCEFA